MEPRKHEKHEPKAKATETGQKPRFQIMKLEPRIAPSNGNFPPGQFPSGNPAQAPGQCCPNEAP
jgi:hypothetical protein